ncbi:hypothetical protein BLA29_010647 [Euroglyphus maynei]|uniref:Uncharacterized protein n=1 Tax=Euroglyphus maynei TaxID=6958 RepID=A0A1Y3BRV0_EURMA|nr:hypothetical protein BLA29_010647 [Euroglyphus maynei]
MTNDGGTSGGVAIINNNDGNGNFSSFNNNFNHQQFDVGSIGSNNGLNSLTRSASEEALPFHLKRRGFEYFISFS